MSTLYTWLDTPLGAVLLTAEGNALTRVSLGAERAAVAPGWERASSRPGVLADACEQLQAYFEGARVRFDVPLAPVGTPFQRRVWDALCAVPYGATASYRDIARTLGDANAVRAVGAANGRNPIGVIVPCHRVVGSDGSLTGYAGGLDRKRWLLRHEATVFGHRADGFALALG